MLINDIHIHPFLSSNMGKEMGISSQALEPVFDDLSRRISDAGIEHAQAIILDSNDLRIDTAVKFFYQVKRGKRYKNLSFSCLIDFRASDSLKLVEKANDLGFKSIKFLPYEQKIGPSDYDEVVKVAKRADDLGLFIVTCCSFGTTKLYDYSGIRLACNLIEHVKCPVVMAHGGGALVLDAVVAALDTPNLYFDLSWSLPFFMGSSVEGDFAFAIRKLGSERCAFGSDAPFIGLKEAVSTAIAFLEKHKFSEIDANNVMFNTTNRLLNGQW